MSVVDEIKAPQPSVGDRVRVRDSYEPLETVTAVNSATRSFTTGNGRNRTWSSFGAIEYVAHPVYMTPERIAVLEWVATGCVGTGDRATVRAMLAEARGEVTYG